MLIQYILLTATVISCLDRALLFYNMHRTLDYNSQVNYYGVCFFLNICLFGLVSVDPVARVLMHCNQPTDPRGMN